MRKSQTFLLIDEATKALNQIKQKQGTNDSPAISLALKYYAPIAKAQSAGEELYWVENSKYKPGAKLALKLLRTFYGEEATNETAGVASCNSISVALSGTDRRNLVTAAKAADIKEVDVINRALVMAAMIIQDDVAVGTYKDGKFLKLT